MDNTQERLEKYMEQNNLELAGHVGVNTGSILIVDPSEVSDDVKYNKFLELHEELSDNKSYYELFNGGRKYDWIWRW